MNVVTSSSLSAIGSSQAPRLVFCPDRRAISPSRPSVMPAVDEHDQRPAEVAVDHEDDERRDQQHPQQRELVCGRERGHLGVLFPVGSPPVTQAGDRLDRFGAAHRT